MAYMRQYGLGEYDKTGDWTWEFYPPPYNFLAPADSVAIPAPVLYTRPRRSGLGGCACAGACGGSGACGDHSGLGLFESGFDVSQWGVGEWVAAAAISYLAVSIVGDLGRGAQRVQRTYRRARARA